MSAVICGRDDIVSTLLSQGASPYIADNRGNTALHLAVVGEHYRVVTKLILAVCDPFAVNAKGQTPRDICDGEIIRVIEELLEPSSPCVDPEIVYDMASTI